MFIRIEIIFKSMESTIFISNYMQMLQLKPNKLLTINNIIVKSKLSKNFSQGSYTVPATSRKTSFE